VCWWIPPPDGTTSRKTVKNGSATLQPCLRDSQQIIPATVLSQEIIRAPLHKGYRCIFKHCLEIIIATNEADLMELDDGRRKP
jgi:hypothetical protein